MIKKNQEIQIDENEIFKNDKLKRKNSIEDLSKLIISNTEPLVLSINASWGSGKTTFVKLWQRYLKKECNVNSIYFSAWEDDFSKEPLISILGEMNSYIENNFAANTTVPKGFKKALNISGKILKRGIPAAIKGATSGFLDIDAGYEEAISAMSEESVKTLIENYSKDKDVLIKFKEAIEKVLNEMDEEKPFIIFIDELDRCRPLYSIELLERIKHVFGIKKLIFVLSIDKTQLSESIKSQYGNINTNNYLKRFIDLEYNLTNSSLDDFCEFMYLKLDFENLLSSKTNYFERDKNSKFHFLNIITKLVSELKLSLRDIEQIFTRINIILKTIELNEYNDYYKIIILFEVLKAHDSKLYNDFINKKISETEIKNVINLNVYRDLSLNFEAIIESTKKSDEEYNSLIEKKEEELNSMIDIRTQEVFEKDKLQFDRLNNLIKKIKCGYGKEKDIRLNNIIDKVINKIEFADKFNLDTL